MLLHTSFPSSSNIPSDSSPDMVLLSQRIISLLYNNEISELTAFLGANIVWVDTTIPCSLYGYYQASSFLMKNPKASPCRVFYMQFHISSPQPGIHIVTGKFRACPKSGRGKRASCVYLTSMIWLSDLDRSKLIHVHISDLTTRSETGSASPLYFHGKQAQTYQILPDEIIYIEAANVNSMIYGTSETFTVSQPISQVAQILPEQFLRVHRSYIINRNYVSRVYRYAVELSSQVAVPIPEKKYMNVVCEIERYQV